jgi:hypothetical protein
VIHSQIPWDVAQKVERAARAYAYRTYPGSQRDRVHAADDFETAAELWIAEGDSYAEMSDDERAGYRWARDQGY